MPGPLIHLFDNGLVAVNEPLNHLHVLYVGSMEEVNNIANKEWYHTHQYVAEGIVQDGQSQRNALDDSRREIDERHDAEQRNGIRLCSFASYNYIIRIASLTSS